MPSVPSWKNQYTCLLNVTSPDAILKVPVQLIPGSLSNFITTVRIRPSRQGCAFIFASLEYIRSNNQAERQENQHTHSVFSTKGQFVYLLEKGRIFMKLFRSLTLAVLLALSICIFPASAANDSGITISTVEPAGGGPGTFTSAGIANGGLEFCTSGIVESSSYTAVVHNKTVTILRKTFTCSDGTGTFVLDVKAARKTTRPSSWSVVGGSGDFGAMWGSGKASSSTDPSPSAPKSSTLMGNFHFR